MERLSIKNRGKNVLAGDMSRRLVSFDLVKMLMMLWVVWGHLGLYGLVEADRSVYMENAKIGVNMPVFFVMAGYFAAATYRNFKWSKIISRVVSYIWPHITLPVVCAFFLVVFFDESLRSVLWKIPFYWFLRTLAMIYFLCAVIFRLFPNNAQRLVALLLTYSVMFFFPDLTRWWWSAQVIHMFPYFVFGLMVLARWHLYRNIYLSFMCGVIYLAAVFIQGDSFENGMSFWRGSVYWNEVLFNLYDFIAFFSRTIVGLTGSLFVLFSADLLVRMVPTIGHLAPLGRTSLGVYVIHEYPMQLIERHISFTPLSSDVRWLVAIAWFLVCHVIVLLIQHIKISRLFFFGDSVLIENCFIRIFRRSLKV